MSENTPSPADRGRANAANFVADVANTAATAELPPGIVSVNGKHYMEDSKGNLIPLETIKPQHKLQDEMVRKVIGFARDLSAQIVRFKGHTFEDLSAFDALLAQQYNTVTTGKGNRTYMTVDGLQKVVVAMADLIEFGPELQSAKVQIDECLREWTDDGRAELRSIITRAFNVDKAGEISKSDLFMLLQLEIEDERWQSAMQAIRDAIRIVGAKRYFRFYERTNQDADWEAISIDLARA